MKTKYLLVALIMFLGFGVVNAQTKVPTGPEAKAAIDAYSKRDFKTLETVFPAMEKMHPKHPYTLFFKTIVKDMKGTDDTELLRDFTEVIRLAPDLSDPILFRGRLFQHKGIYQRAIDDFTKVIEMEKDNNPIVYQYRGESYVSLQNYTAAFDDFKKGATVVPEYAPFYRGVANISFDAKREQEALSFIQQAVNGSQSNNPEVTDVLAGMLVKLQKFSEADNLYTKMLSTAGWNFGAETYSRAGIAAERIGSFSKAKTLAETAVRMAPKVVEFYTNRAGIAVTEQNWEDVHTWAKKALEVNSNDMMANMYMAVGVKRTGRGDALSAEYEKKAYELEKQLKR